VQQGDDCWRLLEACSSFSGNITGGRHDLSGTLRSVAVGVLDLEPPQGEVVGTGGHRRPTGVPPAVALATSSAARSVQRPFLSAHVPPAGETACKSAVEFTSIVAAADAAGTDPRTTSTPASTAGSPRRAARELPLDTEHHPSLGLR
jgi:hypothetical protein